ncbi:MAG: tyrosine-type recombinase/integrase [Planctomycetes bacterium]|nr:tyrosine-type recombinase/integrase [Planctomycetota bacterium]
MESAKVEHGTFHDLRRTCITEWLENGLQPHEVKELAGHSDIQTTMNYYTATRKNLLDKARRASSNALGDVA